MYKIIDNPVIMKKENIDKEFKGKWVYVVKTDMDEHGSFTEGTPVVIGDWEFDGQEDGIYDKYDESEYSRRLSYSLIEISPFSLWSVFGTGVIK